MDLILGTDGGFWAPFETRRTRRDPDRQFNHLPDRPHLSYESHVESDGTIHMELEMPGVPREDLTVEVVDERTLKISGKRHTIRSWGGDKDKSEGDAAKEEGSGQSESYFEVNRSFRLPETADVEKLEATLNNGILRLTIPKKEVEHKTQVITIS